MSLALSLPSIKAGTCRGCKLSHADYHKKLTADNVDSCLAGCVSCLVPNAGLGMLLQASLHRCIHGLRSHLDQVLQISSDMPQLRNLRKVEALRHAVS